MTFRLKTLAALTLTLTAFAAAALAPAAVASKEAIAYFGTEAGTGERGGEFGGTAQFRPPVSVNSTGNGPAARGEIYTLDSPNNRIQRFAQDDNGTPSDRYDDSYPFVAAWGVGVETGAGSYQICTAAASCRAALASDAAGGLKKATDLAVDQDTGDVYVVDSGNHRVVVYSGDGVFLRAFGYDVVASGPDDSGTGYEVCAAADGDVCKAGLGGTGPGQLGQGDNRSSITVSQPDGNAVSGTVFVGDGANGRVDTYSLDGSGPSNFGNSEDLGTFCCWDIAVDSRGIVYMPWVTFQPDNEGIARYDSEGANGGGVGFLAPISRPPLLGVDTNSSTQGLAVQPDPDGPGPETDVLYVTREWIDHEIRHFAVQQFGPANPPGLTAPPLDYDDAHGSLIGLNYPVSLAVDTVNGRLFVSSFANYGAPWSESAPGQKTGVYVLDQAGGPPSASIESVDAVTPTGATVHATVDPNGGPPVSYRLEYSTDGSTWSKTGETPVGAQESPQAISARLDPPGTGLQPNTLYHVRVVATKVFMPAVTTSALTFTTPAEGPRVETVGSPIRTATTARLEARVNPRGLATSYHFEYGSQGPCGENACSATPDRSAGAGSQIEFASEQVGGLEAGTTYHYRVVADNGSGAGPSFGNDMTVTTRSSDAPLSHGHFPGPPGSDRAWEQVSLPDSGGNPVLAGSPFSDDGNRAVYQIPGGTPITDSGSGFNQFFAERTAEGWKSHPLAAPRQQVVGPNWLVPAANGDLSNLVIYNWNVTTGLASLWRLDPFGSPTKLIDYTKTSGTFSFLVSGDASRIVTGLYGTADAALPVAPEVLYFYDISSGAPRMVSLLPGNAVPACGVAEKPNPVVPRPMHMISEDGSRLLFSSKGDNCAGPAKLYLRNIPAETTKLVSGPPLSGPDCGGKLLNSTPGSVFFWSQSRLDPTDALSGCGGAAGGDVYRYSIAEESFECVTCVIPEAAVDIHVGNGPEGGIERVAVAADGSRVYFTSAPPLVPGAPGDSVYRLDVASGALAFVAPGGGSGSRIDGGNAINPDGSVLIFRSSDPRLNQLGGAQNGGTEQYYRYDDRDRSLICVSCPQDGTPAQYQAVRRLGPSSQTEEIGPNSDPLDDSGDAFVFSTPNPLIAADQNTAAADQEPFRGNDLYEWRDGRVLLVSDGLTNWPAAPVAPLGNGISPDGRDVFFTVAAQYTADALDGNARLYDARIGGGFDVPKPPPPCPLEVCQGTPKGAPDEAPPGTSSFVGSGNGHRTSRPRHCRKGARKVRHGGKVRCVKAHPRHVRHRSSHHPKRSAK